MIYGDFDRVPRDLCDRAAQFAASILADVAGRRGALDGRIGSLTPTLALCGSALTVEVRPGDNLMIHAALNLARPGDVLVIDGKGDLSCALMGELMCTHAQAAGVVGVVIDGAVRDTAFLRGGSLPVYAGGACANGPTKCLAGRVGHPVSVGGVCVSSGDLIVGDADGVVVVPRSRIVQVLCSAQDKVRAEEKRRADIACGRVLYDWLEPALRDIDALRDGETLDDVAAHFGGSSTRGA